MRQNIRGICIVFVAAIMLSSCTETGGSIYAGTTDYTVHMNKINMKIGPNITVADSFRYSGAEIVHATEGPIKRQIFAGRNGEFLSITIFNADAGFIRNAVTDSKENEWEYKIKEVTGPKWIRVVGSNSPCCVNLLRSEYLFIPDYVSVWDKNSPLPKDNVLGKVVLVSFGTPIPERLSPNSWATGDNDDFLTGDDVNKPQLAYEITESGMLIPNLSADKQAFLQEKEDRSAEVCQIE